MRSASHLTLLLAVALSGCGGDDDRPAHQTVSAPASTRPISGHLFGGSEGAVVFLVEDDPLARDVYSLAGTLVSSTEVDADGQFLFEQAKGDAVLVLAPGKAIARVPVPDERPLEIHLRPEGRLTVRVGEPYAAALVLDARGVPLPLPAAELVSVADGTLQATQIPEGRFTVVVQSADGERYAEQDVVLAAGEQRSVALILEPNAAVGRRFLRAVGGPALKHPLVLAGEPQ